MLKCQSSMRLAESTFLHPTSMLSKASRREKTPDNRFVLTGAVRASAAAQPSYENTGLLSARIGDLRRQLRAEKARAARHRRRSADLGSTPPLRIAALWLCLETGAEKQAPTDFMWSKLGKTRRCPPEWRDEFGKILDVWWHDGVAEEVDAAVSGSDTRFGRAVEQARKFLLEWRLKQWIHANNVTGGLAPSSRNVCHAWDTIADNAAHEGTEQHSDRSDLASIRNRTWLHRLRKRSGIRLGRIKREDFMSLDVKQAKAIFAIFWTPS